MYQTEVSISIALKKKKEGKWKKFESKSDGKEKAM